ncbi:MAG TPA: Na+/H+ antiporter NhaC family protein [Candidatus Babeliaceae bacterium]|nr:Na+/H+ antiporter NhaC family protein [Candidatus Babeliaceae bacterium]
MDSGTWLSLLPPAFVVLLAVTTRRIILSLILGCISAGIISSSFSLYAGIKLTILRLLQESGFSALLTGIGSYDKLYMFGFLILLGILIELITHSGGIQAYTQTLHRHLTSKKAAQTTSLVLSTLFFIDDYLSSLTVGSIMRNVTDSFKIPRVKLAFLLDSLSAPLCILIPATSWGAMILMQLQVSGISLMPNPTVSVLADPLFIYLSALPFTFYPIFIILSAWFIVRRSISYGLMKKYEEIEQGGSDISKVTHKATVNTKSTKPETLPGSLYDFFLPIGSFIITFIIILLYSGSFKLLGGSNSFFVALANANSFLALFSASLLAISLSITILLSKKAITRSQFYTICKMGIKLMKNSILVLVLAWTFGALLKQDLMTGAYLAKVLLNALNPLLLPLMFFITSTLISATTGSAWGTIIFILPIAIPLATKLSSVFSLQTPLLLPIIAAIFSGAVAGGHFSPITDSTVMASTSAGCNLMDHVYTQISYATPALIGSCVAYLLCGLLIHNSPSIVTAGLSFIIGLAITVSIILLRSKQNKIKR